MAKRSKGRVKKFEAKSPATEAPRRDTYGEGFDVQEFMAEGWRNIEREDAMRDRPREEVYAARQSAARDYPHDQDPAYDPYGTEEHLYHDSREAMEAERAAAGSGRSSRPKTAKAKKPKRKRSKQAVWRLRIYVAIITVLITAVSLSAHHIITLKMEQRELIAQQQELEQRKEELTKELKKVDDPGYIEQKAREKLHLIKPGEILYLLPEDEEASGD